jgi:hypothetical protein
MFTPFDGSTEQASTPGPRSVRAALCLCGGSDTPQEVDRALQTGSGVAETAETPKIEVAHAAPAFKTGSGNCAN